MRSFSCCWFVLAAVVGTANAAVPEIATYRIQHTLTINKIPAGSHQVRLWFWLPDDDDCQKVLDLRVKDAPAGYQLTRDANYGHRYLYAVVNDPAADTTSVATEFLLRRSSVSIAPDASAPDR